jgi:hypothetical protein
MENQTQDQNWEFIAFMIDGEIQHILGTDSQFASILLSDPVIVDITDEENRAALSIGSTYDESRGIYVPRKPFESWTWDEVVKNWKPPVAAPAASANNGWAWSEEELNWVSVPAEAANAI